MENESQQTGKSESRRVMLARPPAGLPACDNFCGPALQSGPYSILHLEDCPENAALVRDTLRAEGVACRLVHARDRGEFVAALEHEDFDLILADHALPSFDGSSASDGTEAVALFAQHKDDIDLVMTDMVMSYLDGPATINALRRLDPNVRIIASNGLGENEQFARELANAAFLLKPFTTEKLLATVNEVIHPPKLLSP